MYYKALFYYKAILYFWEIILQTQEKGNEKLYLSLKTAWFKRNKW